MEPLRSSNNLIQQAFSRLFPDKEFLYETELNYNLRLSDFNSNIRFTPRKIIINMNLQWKDIDDEIKIGLIQSLLLKMFKKKVNSPNIDLYNNFVKNIPILTPKTKTDVQLESAFHRVNQQFFESKLELPNLTWGSDSRRKLASYNFHEDIIVVSTIFKNSSEHILDYLMYHEMLHKWQKFEQKNGRSAFHTKEFREAERKYPNYPEVEKEIQSIIRDSKKSRWSWF
ncbi:MAG: SprT-like domain-containing protein [Candidatus Woesearchaeota archaeon]